MFIYLIKEVEFLRDRNNLIDGNVIKSWFIFLRGSISYFLMYRCGIFYYLDFVKCEYIKYRIF